MTEEIKTEEIQKEEGERKSKCTNTLFTKLAVVTTGAFIGSFLALCVFTTFAKPPIPAYTPMPPATMYTHPKMGHHSISRPNIDPAEIERKSPKRNGHCNCKKNKPLKDGAEAPKPLK